jgi:2-oxoglutarate ferredoxin oxidoreductase subunit alpha
LSDKGYQAPGDRTHIQVLVNPATWDEDLAAAEPGTVIIWNSDTKKKTVEREDIISYPVPMSSLARKINPKIAKLVTNIVYVGVLAELLGIDQECLESAVARQFKGKDSAIELNITALGLGRDYCKENRLRSNDEGQANCAVIQAEDELAAAGMVLGAGWAGGRGMTATSGPGISLMQEFIGLAYFAEIPSVFWDVTRVGPSTGLPTRTQQSDIAMLYEGSHGDTQHIVLIPGTVEECFEYGWRAFDYSERFQTPVFGMSDLDLGMNRWACEGFSYPDIPMDRGKVVRDQKTFDAFEIFGRYLDVDGDGIPYRTLPGSGMAPILYRGTGHNPMGVYSEKPEDYFNLMKRLKYKIDGARDELPAPILREESECEVGIIFLGSMENSIQEIDDILEQTGMKVSQCRVRALPFHSEVEGFIQRHEVVIVLEITRDGQLYGILRRELPNDLVTKVHSVAYSDGMPPRARIYADLIQEKLEEVSQ